MISKRMICLASVLLLGSVATSGAAIFTGSATGEWVRGSVEINTSLHPVPYTGDKWGMDNQDNGVSDSLATTPPTTSGEFNPSQTPVDSPEMDGSPTALFWWGDPGTGAGDYDLKSSPNKFNLDGVGSTGDPVTMDTENIDTNGIFKFADFWYTNGDTYAARGVVGVDLSVNFFIQEINETFNLTGTFGIYSTLNDTGDVDDEVSISGFHEDKYFTYEDIDYRFTVLGFSQDEGTSIVPLFVAPEDSISYAGLYAEIVEVPVPEPGTILLFGVGVIGLLGTRLRK